MCESKSLERPRFFSGKLLTAEDLTLEQQYFREKLKRHNRTLHGWGIVCGLKVNVHSGQVVVEPGMALDCEGNEIVIGTAQSMPGPAAIEGWHNAFVNISFVEEASEPVPVFETEEPSIIKESYEIAFAQENCNRDHRHLRGRWLACGKPHALTIAKLRHHAEGWRVDHRYRAPAIK